jgi:hypothetical protein
MNDGGDWEPVIRSMLDHACELIQQMLVKFRDKLDVWLNGLLSGPIPVNWREELSRFVAEVHQDGLDIRPDGIATLEAIIQCRVDTNSHGGQCGAALVAAAADSPNLSRFAGKEQKIALMQNQSSGVVVAEPPPPSTGTVGARTGPSIRAHQKAPPPRGSVKPSVGSVLARGAVTYEMILATAN